MKNKKRLCAAVLASVTLLTACGSGTVTETQKSTDTQKSTETQQVEETTVDTEVASKYPEYLNLESAYPIVKDEYADEITLSVAILMQDNAGEWEDLWVNKYFKEKYNINLEVEYIHFANQAERVNLILNSGELPDMLINCGLTTAQIMEYGVEEGLLLQMDQYMDETLTPNILRYFEDDIYNADEVCTAPDGHVYAVPSINEPLKTGSFKRIFINKTWLDELELEMPSTLDEFVDLMYALKEADPADGGSENFYPFGGSAGEGNGWYILNALGYVDDGGTSGTGYGMDPCVRDGEAVLPVYDMEVFQEYLKIMNQFYTDGIINPTYFTMESTEINAQLLEGKAAMCHNAPSTYGLTNFEDWESMSPLTSEWQTEAEIDTPVAVGRGAFYVSADTEYPELCMRFADMFFNNDTDFARAFQGYFSEEWNFDSYINNVFDEEKNTYVRATEYPAGVESDWQYRVEYLIGNVWQFGSKDNNESVERLVSELGYPDYKVSTDWEGKEGPELYVTSMHYNMAPYAAENFPSTYYLTSEESEKMSELLTVIKPYVEEQVSLFITGRRPLSETGDFVEELEALGMKELSDLYKKAYASVKS